MHQGDATSSAAPLRLGVGHTLRLWRGEEQVDFRLLIERLASGIRALDPGDPRARRLPSGVALTADGWEAELATPPVVVSVAAPSFVDDVLRAERTELRDLAAPYGIDRVSGLSTHLNVTVPDERAVEIGRRLVETCARGLAAITEPDSSRGVFVRPRRGRLELGCEYAEGERLVAVLTLLSACVMGLWHGHPPVLGPGPRLEPSREKFGWYVSPDQLLDIDALPKVWSWASTWADELGLDPDPVEKLLDRKARPSTPSACTFGRSECSTPVTDARPRVLGDGITAETEWLTWEHAVWLFRAPSGHECRAVVRTDQEAEFLDDLDHGAMNLMLAPMLRRPVVRRQLLVNADLGDGGLFHDVRPGALVPAERLVDGSVPVVSRRAGRRHLHRFTRNAG